MQKYAPGHPITRLSRYRRLIVVLGTVAMIGYWFPVGAESASGEPDPAEGAGPKSYIGTITVEASRDYSKLVKQASAFVSAVAARPQDESLVRWGEAICPLVAGLPKAQGEFVLGRLSQIAQEAGAPVSKAADCRPNFYVIATAKPDELLKAWRKRDMRLFGDGRGPNINRFMNDDRAVRVWYNADLTAANGMPVTVDANASLGFSSPTGGLGTNAPNPSGGNNQALAGIPTNSHAKLSRLEWDELHVLSSIIVVVDTQRAQGVNFSQLADYVAMIGLTQVRQDVQLADTPSILNLFTTAADSKPTALTNWDQAYLKAMYATDQRDKMQQSVMETYMAKDLAPTVAGR